MNLSQEIEENEYLNEHQTLNLNNQISNKNWLENQEKHLDILLKKNYINKPDIFAKNILCYLAEISNAYRGVFFITNEFGDTLEAVATYGCLIDQLPQKKFEFGESLIGQAALSQKNIYFEDLDPQSVQVVFSFVNVSIDTILIKPLLFNGEVYGVLKLDFLTKPNTDFLVFLTMANDKIAPLLESILLQSTNESLILDEQKIIKELEIYNKRIIEGISYAKRIQDVILPTTERINEFFSDHFVIFEPKDIVSGDFYWFAQIENKTYIAVVDCTGHGVAGAFMSMIGNTLLNQIILEKDVNEPSEILNYLHKNIRTALKQDTTKNTAGMDLALCCLERQTNQIKLTFAGAKSNLYCMINNELIVYKGNRISIGGINADENLEFDNHIINLNKEDILYLTSDGFVDTCNVGRKKFGEERLKNLILDNYKKEMRMQKHIFFQNLQNFKSFSDQRDDVTLLGLKL